MKIHTGMLMVGMMSASLFRGESLTNASIDESRSIIDAAIELHVGVERLTKLTSVAIKHEYQRRSRCD